MVTVEEIVNELELKLAKVESLDAETACKEEIESVLKRFEIEKDEEIKKLRASIDAIKEINGKLEAEKTEAELADTETEMSVNVGE